MTINPQILHPSAVVPDLSPRALADLLRGAGEIAVLDVRDLTRHVEDGHILLSVPLPLGLIETRIARLVPRHDVPVVVYDAGNDGLANRAAERLRSLGYSDVAVLAGGVDAWRNAGLEVYTGIHVLSKAFGEHVEHTYGTPNISVSELKGLLDGKGDVVVLDGRSLEEFNNFSIPGAWACPNAELPYRAHDLIPSDQTLVVVNCAGRTRSIIGAQALINSGLPNRVVALENGAMAWLTEGHDLDTGSLRPAPAPSVQGLERARLAAAAVRTRFGVPSVDRAGLLAAAQDPTRSFYLLDVRTRAEYESGHLPGSAWAEGGQLVQGTDQWIGTLRSRVVLVDDADGVRAAITASWLRQLGWSDVATYAIDPTTDILETGPEPALIAGQPPEAETIPADDLQAELAAGRVFLIDFSPSAIYEQGHIPGARFALRSRIDGRLARAAAGQVIVVTASDPSIARLAARDVSHATGQNVRLLAGGTAAWLAAGLPLAGSDDAGADVADWHDPADDVWKSPYFRKDRFGAFREYIDWEINLINQIGRDETVSFPAFPA